MDGHLYVLVMTVVSLMKYNANLDKLLYSPVASPSFGLYDLIICESNLTYIKMLIYELHKCLLYTYMHFLGLSVCYINFKNFVILKS